MQFVGKQNAKQRLVSTTEAKYQAVASSAREALWLRQLLPDFGISLKQFMIRTDSMGAMIA
jgi:hypothetical protein